MFSSPVVPALTVPGAEVLAPATAAVPAEYLVLDVPRLAAAILLIGLTVALSGFLRLGLVRPIVVASVRCVVQLVAVGFVLEFVFAHESTPLVLAVLLLMTAASIASTPGSVRRRYRGLSFDIAIALCVSVWSVEIYALSTTLAGPHPFFHAQYAIPVMGMLLGNSLSGVALGLRSFLEATDARLSEVELRLTCGATRWEAARPLVREALRTGLTPAINALAIVGVVSLPGMMTGQIAAGASPGDAVRYQIAIMFLITATVTLGTTAAVLLAWRRIYRPDHTVAIERLAP